MKIYGPYANKTGRKQVIVIKDGKRKTTAYARFLLQQHLGRNLTNEETVDHKNGDFTDDRIENLQILTRAENIRKSAKPAELLKKKCLYCGDIFLMLARQYRHNQIQQKKRGPFCSRHCAGKVFN